MIWQLEEKFGKKELSSLLKQYGIHDGDYQNLTTAEASTLLTAKDVDAARNRIVAARQSLGLEGKPGSLRQDGDQASEISPPSTSEPDAGADSGVRFSKSRANPDVNPTPERRRLIKEWGENTGSIVSLIPKKGDIGDTRAFVATAEYTLCKDEAGQRMLDAAGRRMDNRVALENGILDGIADGASAADHQAKHNSFINTFKELQKDSPQSYKKVNDYLLEVDKTGEGFRLHRVSGHAVFDEAGNFVGVGKNKEQAGELVRDHVKERLGVTKKGQKAAERAKLTTRYRVDDKADLFEVLDPKGKPVRGGRPMAETEAVAKMIESEGRWLRRRGYEANEVAAVATFRAMTNRAFDKNIADWKAVLARCEELGIDAPGVDVLDESRRWGVVDKNGKVLAGFATEAEAKRLMAMAAEVVQATGKGSGKAKMAAVRKLKDNEIRKNVSLNDAIAKMGDLRGVYFPRQRDRGGIVMRAVNEATGEQFLEKFDAGWIAKDGGVRVVAGTPLSRRAKELGKKGFEVTIEREAVEPEAVFEARHLVSSIAAMMDESLEKAQSDKTMTNEERRAFEEIHKAVIEQAAGIVQRRGFLSSRQKRAADYWQGFETDMLKAGVGYAKGLAAGIAKRNLAQELTMALTGRDISWKAWQAENPGGGFEDYQTFVNDRKIDPKTQKNLYTEAISWCQEVLRNDERADRIIGTMKGFAVIKYMGFSISSSAVNLMNLTQAVPATISSHTGRGLTQAMTQINRSLFALAQAKLGKADAADGKIFADISARGWDSPQFNHEAADVMRSRMGNAWAKFTDASMWMFGKTEEINRAATIHAAYREWQKAQPSLGHEELMRKAKHASDRAHGVYGKETAPVWTRGSGNPLKLAWTFQKFVHNYLLNTGEMLGKGEVKNVAWMLLSPAILGGAGSSLATPVLAALCKAFGVGGDDPEEEMYKWAEKTFGGDAWLRHGIPGLFGVNFKGSLEIRNPFPRSMKEVGDVLGGAPISVLVDEVKGIQHAAKGEWLKAGENIMPNFLAKPIRGYREYTEGVTTESYGRVWYGDKPLKATPTEAFLRGLSFNPSRISAARERQRGEKEVAGKYAEQKSKLNSEIKRLTMDDSFDEAAWSELVGKIEKFNDGVIKLSDPEVTPITVRSIKGMLKRNNRAGKRERFREVED